VARLGASGPPVPAELDAWSNSRKGAVTPIAASAATRSVVYPKTECRMKNHCLRRRRAETR
jgi:hypothetical protein